MLLPIIGSIIGRSFAFLLTFPLEPIVIKVQGTPVSAPFPKMSEIKIFQGLSSTFCFEMSLSVVYWTVFHNLFQKVDNYYGGKDVVKATIVTGVISSSISTTLSHPFDIGRSMKILDSQGFGHLNISGVLKKVSRVYGAKGFVTGKICVTNFIGLGAKYMRAMLSSTMFMYVYALIREELEGKGF